MNPDEARKAASEILSQRKYRATTTPRPFRGILDKLGEWLHPITEAAKRAFAWLAARLPGGRASVWSILGGLVIVAAAGFALWLARRRARVTVTSATRLRGEAGLDPAALERAAETAEAAGDLEDALRLRFRAGLLRLDRAKVIAFRESVTSHEVAVRLRSPAFEHLARDFDEVVYGRREPRPEDIAAARSEWVQVLEEAGAS